MYFEDNFGEESFSMFAMEYICHNAKKELELKKEGMQKFIGIKQDIHKKI